MVLVVKSIPINYWNILIYKSFIDKQVMVSIDKIVIFVRTLFFDRLAFRNIEFNIFDPTSYLP